MCQQIWKTKQRPQDWKRSVFIPIPKIIPKSVQTTEQLQSFHMIVRLRSKCFKLGLSSTWTENFWMYKVDLEKAEEPGIKLSTFIGSKRKQGSSRKTSTSASLTMLNCLTVWITTNCGKFFKRWEYQTTLPVSWKTCMQVKKQQLEHYMAQLTDSEFGKEYVKAVYCHPTCLNSMQSTLWEMPGWINHSWNQDCCEKYEPPQICRWYHSNGRKWRGTKSLLMRVKEESERVGLKLNIVKLRSWHLVP